MRSPLSLMAASSGEKEQNVPCDGGEEATSDKSVKEGKDLVNGSPDEDFALINFVGMKMGDGLDKISEVGESSESKVGTEHSSDEKETEQSTKEDVKAVKDEGVVRREPRAKMSISPARLLGRSLLGLDKTANGDTGKASSKTQCNSIVDGEATDGTDSGISSLSNCEVETRTCDGGSEASSTTSSAALSVTGEKLVNGRVSEERGEEGDSTSKLSSASSSNSKALPKARKSVQSASKTSVKTVNLAPISNKTVKLADLESALKCDKVIDSDSSKKEESEEDLTNNNVDSTGETKDSKNSVKVKKKRKFRTGNYSFPGQKKKKRYLKKCDEGNSVDNSCDRSVSSTASVEDMEGLDGEGDDSLNSSTEPRLDSNEGTNAMTVLSQNSHLAFRAAGKAKITARKKIRPSPKGKSLKDMLDSMKRAQALRQQADLESKENSNSRTEFSDEERNDFVDGDDMQEESETMTALRKRKTHAGGDNSSSDEDETHMETSAPVLNSSLSGKKQRTEERNETTPTKPVVTIVSEHTPTPGLKSLLPKPVTSQSSLSGSKDLSSPLAVLSNQLAASRNSSVPKPMGPKNSEALRALLVSGSSFGGRSGTVTTMPVTGQVKQECGELINGERVVAPRDSKGASTPNGLCYPVTPPKTPEDGTACDNSSRPPSCPTSAAGTSPDRDIIPLCCCKINGASFNKLTSGVTYCQALDSVDGKVMGCCNKVSNSQLVRPAVKIPFMAVCEAHRKRLKLHQCCPGCGHFCTQGKFYQCGKEGGAWMHSFHKQCQVFKDGRFYCPHCGEESVQMEVSLGYTDQPHSAELADTSKNSRRSLSKLKPSFVFAAVKGKESELGETAPGVSFTLPSSRTISSEGLPLGPSRNALEKMLNSLEQERPKKYRNLSKSMYLPAYEGDLEKVIYMLIDGVDPNLTYEDYEGETALHGAAASDHLSIVHVLVQAGAALHLKDRTLKTPLMMAAEHNKPRVVQYLLKVGARIDDKGEDGMTSIHYAAKAGHTEVIKLLLDSDKIGPNIQDDGGWTPIIWAAESQLVTTVKYLMSQGADPTLKDNEENTGLHWAAYAGSVPIMDLFLEYGCELDTPNEHGDRPLHIAARQNHYECVVLLLARGADVETRNNNQETPLTCCLDQTSSTWMALKVNKQLKGFAAKLARPEKLLHRDVSCGREKNPIACVNAIDEESFPNDYLYVAENVETSPLNINRVITSLQSCRCKDDCSSQFCVCARSSVKCWFDKYGRLTTDFNLVEPPLLFECNKACRCWTNCNNRVVQNGITCRLQLFRTNGRGWGVKTLTDISPGTFICEYIGELISDSEADRREDDSYLFDLDNKDGETYCIDARKYGNVSRFINHLCEPNVVPVKVFVDHQDLRFPRICFFSSREIRAHEELGFDYGEKFWIIKWKQFTCACQSPKCKYSSETIHKTLQEYRIRHEEEELPTPADV